VKFGKEDLSKHSVQKPQMWLKSTKNIDRSTYYNFRLLTWMGDRDFSR